jgi:hypothetical protein
VDRRVNTTAVGIAMLIEFTGVGGLQNLQPSQIHSVTRYG